MQPLATAIDQVTDFPYEVMFPAWAVDVVERVAPLKQFLQGAFRLVTEEFKAQIVARMQTYTEQLRAQLLAMAPQAVQDIHAKAKELGEIAKAQVDAAKLQALGLDLTDADTALANFDTSVLYMNSYNSIAGALANQAVVFSTAPTSFFGGGPVSFDASYQVGYNQLSVCDGLREAFYPCGTSAIESLQGDFRACEALDVVTPEMEPPAECHDGSAVEFVDDPNPAQCVRRHLEQIVHFDEGHLGSYTLAIPPSLSDRGPECVNPEIAGLVLGGSKDDDAGDGAEPESSEDAGCACSAGPDASPWGAALLLLLPALRRRRRRV
jgi:MYXO-CTERM domain-containing protein